MKQLLCLLVLVMSLSAAAQPAAIANKMSDSYTTTEGKKISRHHPAAFIRIPGANGFMSENGTETVVVGQVPQPYSTVQPTFTTQALKESGMPELGREAYRINGLPATLIKVEQNTGVQEVIKYILVIGDDKTTFVINGQYPKEAPEQDKAVKATVLSVIYHPSAG